ncbi:sialidase family protein [Sphingobacterium daejeonense]|uniref:sialidase family protein n=1 Tax=Sphingobacterium daejeonense TaxID=371142 RepID=UPI001E3E56E0|nr:sialidase family protein [Sphingobacterium daejeonense]
MYLDLGMMGYASYRIPAIIKNKNGELIAFSEGRVDHAGDYGNVDIVYKVSKDNGKTWGGFEGCGRL